MFKPLLLALVMVSTSATAVIRDDSLSFGVMGTVHLYIPSTQPKQVVLFLSGDGGWTLGVIEMARLLSLMDAVVAGIDIVHFIKKAGESGEKCWYPAADLEALSKTVQRHLGFTEYLSPVLVGYSSGATLVYAVLAQAPAATFLGGISLGFCPDLTLTKPLCRGTGLDWQPGPKKSEDILKPDTKLGVPWFVLHGNIDQVCDPNMSERFVNQTGHGKIVRLPKVGHGFSVEKNWLPQFKVAFSEITSTSPGTEPPRPTDTAISDLPVVELTSQNASNDLMVIHYTGDGGWGVTDKGISEAFVSQGIPVAAMNSLKYFWNRKTPEIAAADLKRIIDHYSMVWQKNKIILVGYSFGADVMPFLVNRLPLELRQRISLMVLLGPSTFVDFEFHLTDWLGGSPKQGFEVLPEIKKMTGIRLIAFYGGDENGSIAPQIGKLNLGKVIEIPGGHRIGKNYEPVAKEILKMIQK
jgi:type IV secretory pathway VirJ component